MAALSPLADSTDLAAWLGRPIGDDATARAEAVLSHASTRVRTYTGQTWETDDVPDAVRDVTVRVAARVFRNPEGLDSVTLDDGTKRWGSVRGLMLSEEDREDLAEFCVKGRHNPGFGVISTTRDEGLGETIFVPTGPPPAGYDFPWYAADDPMLP